MAIQEYMSDIQKIVHLSENDSLELLRQYAETPTIAIRNKLVEQNLRLVFKVASSYRRSGIPYADLVAEGNIGLIRGIEKFDLGKGVKLGYYLYSWIQATILRYIINNTHLVKVGTTVAQRKLIFNLAKLRAKARALEQKLSDEEIAEMLDVKVEEVQEMEQRLSAPVIYIDETSEESNNDHNQHMLWDYTESENTLPDAVCAREEICEVVDKFMNRLNDTHRDIFESRFLNDNEETFDSIGKRLDITKQRAQQIDAALRAKFRKFVSHNQFVI